MIFIAVQQGLGDGINYASLYAQYAAQERVAIPCPEHNRDNMKSFLDGLDIELVPCESDELIRELLSIYPHSLPLEIFAPNFNADEHIKQGYEAAGLNYWERDKYCPIRSQIHKIEQIPIPDEPYAFVPEGGSTGEFHINRILIGRHLKVIVPPNNALLLAYADIIKNAQEIHCHDTSWPWLIDKIPTNGKLFFHHYARPCGYNYDILFLKDWNRIHSDKIHAAAPKYTIAQRGRIVKDGRK
jgi:hypothetical protein